MRFRSLVHLLESVRALVHPDRITVLGSAALLASTQDLGETGQPLEFTYDADLLLDPVDEETAQILNEAVGEQSFFSKRHGCYADVLRPSIRDTLPGGWDERLLAIPTVARAVALHPYDVALIKLILGREKDLSLVTGLLERNLINPDRLREHYQRTPLREDQAAAAGRHLHTVLRKR